MIAPQLDNWRQLTPDRQCGTCYACCIHLGINELKKHPGTACKHLDGTNPTKRCSIYENRPVACKRYSCMWVLGIGPDDIKPNISGMLVTFYSRDESSAQEIDPITNPSMISATITVFDPKKAQSTGKLDEVIIQLLNLGIGSIKTINTKTNQVVFFQDGKIYNGRLLKSFSYEDLRFEAYDPPIGTYETKEAG